MTYYVAASPAAKDCLARAVDVFGDELEAGRWMRTPNDALQGKTPWQTLDTESGYRDVDRALSRIEREAA